MNEKGTESLVQKLNGYLSQRGAIEMTPERKHALRERLYLLSQCLKLDGQCHALSAGEDMETASLANLTKQDLEEVGRMDYWLNFFYSDGKLPPELKQYADFVARVKHIHTPEAVEIISERRLQRDRDMLQRNPMGTTLEVESDPGYASSLVNIIEAKPVEKFERSKLVVMYEGATLYKEPVSEEIFRGLPRGTNVTFNYTLQGLEVDMEQTIVTSPSAVRSASEVERVIVESLAKDASTKKYRDDLYENITAQITQVQE